MSVHVYIDLCHLPHGHFYPTNLGFVAWMSEICCLSNSPHMPFLQMEEQLQTRLSSAAFSTRSLRLPSSGLGTSGALSLRYAELFVRLSGPQCPHKAPFPSLLSIQAVAEHHDDRCRKGSLCRLSRCREKGPAENVKLSAATHLTCHSYLMCVT